MRIIAVDDEQMQLYGLKKKISHIAPCSEFFGFKLPMEALAYAEDYFVNVAFLKMEMPGMHGLILAKKLQTINPRINIIFISAEMNKPYAEEGFKMYASGYMIKPISEERLAEEMKHLRYQ